MTDNIRYIKTQEECNQYMEEVRIRGKNFEPNSATEIMTNSQKIEKIICFLESINCKVIRHSNELPHSISGRCIYTKSEIHLNCFSSEEALYTLLHEAGHWVSYIRLFIQQGKKQPDVSVREKLAYLYGWYVIKHLELGISKNEWRQNWDN